MIISNFIFLALIGHSFGLNIELAYEGSCIDPPTVEIDPKMLKDENQVWYITMLNDYELYRNAEEFLETPINMIPESTLEKACLACKMGKKVATCVGFGDKEQFHLTPIDGSFSSYDWKSESAYGRNYVTLTDNKTYMVSINYWENAHLGYTVFSTKSKMSEEEKKKIMDHLDDFGFDPEKMHEVNFDKCKPAKDEL